ncbi:HNH endonuclease [Neobacillus vireti]|uniref:HNH endonuclease n=1 Tax=Neobacillus vireti TaxID=220686 RepID=UPI00300011EA
MEQWKDFEGYKVSSHGRVLKKNVEEMKGFYDQNGYKVVDLHGNGRTKVKKRMKVHRLVAMLFVENPDNKPHVNHIDGQKGNNHFENLEWVTHKENMKHARKMKLIDQNKPVEMVEVEAGSALRVFESTNEASRETGIAQGNIVRVCKGERKTAGGFRWRYKEGESE